MKAPKAPKILPPPAKAAWHVYRMKHFEPWHGILREARAVRDQFVHSVTNDVHLCRRVNADLVFHTLWTDYKKRCPTQEQLRQLYSSGKGYGYE